MALSSIAAVLRGRSAASGDGAAGSSALRLVLPAFLAGKLIGVLVPMATVWARSDIPGHPPWAALVQPLAGWDGDTYRTIAEQGYPAGPLDLTPGHPGHLWGFFPGYPMLVRAVAFVIPDTVTAGIVASAVCELVALWYLARLIRLETGDDDSARFGTWLLAVFPYAVFLSALYTESAFLAGACAALYYIRRGNTGAASVAAGFAVAMRITGVALVAGLLLEYLLRRRWRPGWGLLAILGALLPLLGFVLYAQHLTGDALAYQHVQQSASYGNRTTTFPLFGWWHTVQAVTDSFNSSTTTFIYGNEVLWGTVGFLALVLMAVWWRRIPPSLTLFAAGIWALGASLTYWLGMPRYEMAMVPIYLAAALLTRGRPQLRMAVLALSCAWFAFDASLLGTGAYAG